MIIIGYAGVFGVKDKDGGVILPQAFSWKFKQKIPLLCQHNGKQVFGEVIAIKADAYGLLVRAKLIDIPDKRVQNLVLKVFNGFSSLSIGYVVKQSYYDKETNKRYIEKLDLIEVSIVSFAANQNAKILQVISQSGNLDKFFIEYANKFRSKAK